MCERRREGGREGGREGESTVSPSVLVLSRHLSPLPPVCVLSPSLPPSLPPLASGSSPPKPSETSSLPLHATVQPPPPDSEWLQPRGPVKVELIHVEPCVAVAVT